MSTRFHSSSCHHASSSSSSSASRRFYAVRRAERARETRCPNRAGWRKLVVRISVSTWCNQRTTPLGAMLSPFRPLRQLHPRVTHWRGTLNSPLFPFIGIPHSSLYGSASPLDLLPFSVHLSPASTPPKYLLSSSHSSCSFSRRNSAKYLSLHRYIIFQSCVNYSIYLLSWLLI